MANKRILFFPLSGWAGRFRYGLAAEHLAGWLADHKIELAKLSEGETFDANSADAFVFCGAPKPSLIDAAVNLRQRGAKLVWSLDDDFWSLPDHILKLRPWPHRSVYDVFLGQMDAVWVTTHELGRRVVGRNRRLKSVGFHLTPDLHSTQEWAAAEPCRDVVPPKEPGVFRVGWQGGNSHDPDTAFFPELVELLPADIALCAVGGGDVMKQVNWRPQDVYVPFTPWDRFVGTLKALDLDLMLAPLAEHPFNEAKSRTRLATAGMLGLPVLASDYGPYSMMGRVVDYCHEKHLDAHDWLAETCFLRDCARSNPGGALPKATKLADWVRKSCTWDNGWCGSVESWKRAILEAAN